MCLSSDLLECSDAPLNPILKAPGQSVRPRARTAQPIEKLSLVVVSGAAHASTKRLSGAHEPPPGASRQVPHSHVSPKAQPGSAAPSAHGPPTSRRSAQAPRPPSGSRPAHDKPGEQIFVGIVAQGVAGKLAPRSGGSESQGWPTSTKEQPNEESRAPIKRHRGGGVE
jgi:hypothetical protein